VDRPRENRCEPVGPGAWDDWQGGRVVPARPPAPVALPRAWRPCAPRATDAIPRNLPPGGMRGLVMNTLARRTTEEAGGAVHRSRRGALIAPAHLPHLAPRGRWGLVSAVVEVMSPRAPGSALSSCRRAPMTPRLTAYTRRGPRWRGMRYCVNCVGYAGRARSVACMGNARGASVPPL